MNKLILPLILFLSLNSYGDEFFYRMLSQVNSEWKYQDDGLKLAATLDLSQNKSFDDWIATHLMLVEQTLRKRTTENLSKRRSIWFSQRCRSTTADLTSVYSLALSNK